MTYLPRWFSLAVAGATLLAAPGCLEDKAGSSPDLCGSGDLVTVDSSDFCVFSSALIIEGFRCPEAFPHGFPGGGGEMVCAEEQYLDDDDVERVIEEWSGSEPPGDAVDAEDPDTTTADSATMDTSVAEDVGPTPVLPTLCAVSHDVEAGAYLAVADEDTSCLVEQACDGDGLIVQCGLRLFCDCVHGDQVCTAYYDSGCPAREADLGFGCTPGLVERACADGLYCQQFSPTAPATCQALPASCGDGACFEGGDCPAGEVCYGAAPFTPEGAVQGGCAAPGATLGACWTDADCPVGWGCDGGPADCDACGGCDLGAQSPGTCAADAGIQPAMWFNGLDQTRGDLAAGVTPHWAVPDGWGASGSLWLPCPSYDLQVRDEPTGAWQPVASETECAGGSLREISGGLTALSPIVAEDRGGREARGWVWLRLKGTYYTGCQAGQGVSSCAGGPVERFSDAILTHSAE